MLPFASSGAYPCNTRGYGMDGWMNECTASVSVPAGCLAEWRCNPGSLETLPHNLCRLAAHRHSAVAGRQRAGQCQRCSRLQAPHQLQQGWEDGTPLWHRKRGKIKTVELLSSRQLKPSRDWWSPLGSITREWSGVEVPTKDKGGSRGKLLHHMHQVL